MAHCFNTGGAIVLVINSFDGVRIPIESMRHRRLWLVFKHVFEVVKSFISFDCVYVFIKRTRCQHWLVFGHGCVSIFLTGRWRHDELVE